MTRVPGCVATVYVVAKRRQQQQQQQQQQQHHEGSAASGGISLYGNADAIVSRGFLSVLKDHLEGLTLDQVLELDPEGVADAMGLRPALSKGRNDGLANMVRIIQNQLQTKNNDDDDDDDRNANAGETSSDEQTDSSVPNLQTKPTVALLLSGGVDSSVAFRLLLEEGYDVVPFYLKIWLEDELAHLGECPWEDDVTTCRQVCDQVGIELQIVSLQEEYHQRVMRHTLNECSLGRTPNPDILCNSRVKFGCFLEYLEGSLPNQFDYIASGHYAQVQRTPSEPNINTNGEESSSSSDSNPKSNEAPVVARLFRAPDPVKDQSYFLCALNQAQLSRLLFPIGHLEKKQVRELAEAFELPNRHRPDSQGLCFLGKVKFRDFMQIHLGEKPGTIVDAVTGETIGKHHGVWYHTVGQRKGIGPYLEPKASSKGPWYVVAKDPSQNIVFASNRYDEDVFVQARSEFHVENIGWITGKEPIHLLAGGGDATESRCYNLVFKIRHGPKLATGSLELPKNNDNDNEGGIVRLDAKDGGLAPGQYVVFYTEDAECLGGGIISERHWARFLLEREDNANTNANTNADTNANASANVFPDAQGSSSSSSPPATVLTAEQ